MLFSIDQIRSLAKEHFQLDVSVKPLPGEIDLNFKVETNSGAVYTLKIANPAEPRERLDMQNAMMRRLQDKAQGLEIPRVVSSVRGEEITDIVAPDGSRRFLRLLTWIEGRCFADVNPHTSDLLDRVGAMCGQLSGALVDFEHPAAHRFIKWDPSQAAWTRNHLDKITDSNKRRLADYFLQLFEKQALSLFPELRKSICYCDANDYNILVSYDLENPTVPGVIDFGDVVFTHTVNELAIAAAYLAMHKPDPLTAIMQATAGFHRVFPLTEKEVEALFPLIGARLLISVTCSAMNLAENPENEYLQISDRPAWELLEKLQAISPALAHASLRHACGWEPHPTHAAFVAWANENRPRFSPIVEANLQEAVWLDLSVGSPDLGGWADIEDAQKLHRLIDQTLYEATLTSNPQNANSGKLLPGIGKYNEVRPFYTSDAYEVQGNEGPQWRTVHIGLDVFLPPGTPVFAPYEGVIHSFQDNANDRDYGPTIILKHQIPAPPDSSFAIHHSPFSIHHSSFYTLYGHLTRTSLQHLKVGQVIKAGEKLCEIGPMPENGNWSPHLHFQVMLDLLGCSGDFPGVAFPEKRGIWTSICPNPGLICGPALVVPEQKSDMDKERVLHFRQNHLGKNLSVSYRRPLKMERGWRQYLFDDTGRRYLDTVNNVAHVGHEHPRVVRAGQRQMAVLNTNTRYLHDNIMHFADALLNTFPPELEVAFFVNSGSEANELAMRLAKNYTQQKDMIVVEVGYHGNTQGCVEVSSYKFDGPGGRGAAPHVHVAPLPDAFRGLYRGNTLETGRKYAAHMAELVDSLRQQGRGPAAFLCESVISCGGQITLPPGYLAAAVSAVRAAGGLYIADEVQTGCGRHGAYFWAFQEHQVVPDIVTIGKPLGNGHPVAAVVTTRAVADAFANGMEYFNTFGGNPVSCAIGLEVLNVIREERLQQNAFDTGAYLHAQLWELSKRFPGIGDVRGPGLFLGFELISDPETLAPDEPRATYLANRMRELGILMSTDGPAHNVLKIKPPIVFDRSDADFLMDTLDRVFREDFMRM
ncbi:MAG: aminotransferase class III-fold pyridoxal phosphate-dependent enzyme [Saprospiraceae bacterium]|nr:aminotransferase class III-fold pyridoxal phosphate-dependent enzyme [Saprospiraceae bacterium]